MKGPRPGVGRSRGMRRLVAAGIVLLGGCGGGSSEGPEPLAVSVSEAQLELRVGGRSDPTYAFTWFPRLEVDAAGRMYTLHPNESLIRVFEPDGTLALAMGGAGEGPGELGMPTNLGWVSDTLWVLDVNGYRISRFSKGGEYLESFPVPFHTTEAFMEVQPPRAQGVLSDGTIYGGPPAFSHQIHAGTFTEYQLMRMNRDGSVIDTVARVPVGRNQWAISDPENPNSGGSYGPQPFADGPIWGLVPDEPAVIRLDRSVGGRPDGSSFSVARVTFSGDTVFSRSYVTESVEITDAEVESILSEAAAPLIDRGLAPATARRWVELGFHRPAVRPAVTDMAVGRTGEIWLRETIAEEASRWLRLSAEGEPIQRVLLPHRMTILLADEDRIWGSESDELGVPFLVRFRIPDA